MTRLIRCDCLSLDGNRLEQIMAGYRSSHIERERHTMSLRDTLCVTRKFSLTSYKFVTYTLQ